jgi:hypothetical protein
VWVFGVGVLGADTGAGHLEDDGVVDEAIDRSGGGHRILEDPVPLAEDAVAADDHGAALVTLREEGEQDLHFVAALLDVPEVVAKDGVEAVEDRQLLLEPQVALGREEALDERVGRVKSTRCPRWMSSWPIAQTRCVPGRPNTSRLSPRSTKLPSHKVGSIAAILVGSRARVSVARDFSAGKARLARYWW